MSWTLDSDPSLTLCAVSELTPRPVDWLWPGRLALGKLTIFDGDPGLSKSLVALDLCARLSIGQTFPDGTSGPGPASCIVLSAEDGPEDTIMPRLQALGADTARVFVICRGDKGLAKPLQLPSKTHNLEEVLKRTGARLVVIDPVTAFLDQGVNTASDQSVRRALFPLVELADRYGCVIILLRHLNKEGGYEALYRGGGSIGFVAICRSAWLFAPDPAASERVVIAQVKNNLAPPQPSLAYTILNRHPEPPLVSWLGPSPLTARQLLAGAARPPQPSPRDRARAFLTDCLANGPRTSREIWAAAEEQGLSQRTLERAKQELEVRSQQVWANGNRLSYWLLEGQELPPTIPPDDVVPDLEPWLAPLREQFPPSTPLDDL